MGIGDLSTASLTPCLDRDLPRFLRELSLNNNKDWFDAHRDRYQTSYVGPALALIAAMAEPLAALDPPLTASPKVNGSLRRINRDLVMDILGGHPRVDLLEPEGAFYAFPRIEGVRDSLSLARRILHERKVGTAPGYTFGRGNDAHLRLCFAIDTPRLKEALERIVQVLDD